MDNAESASNYSYNSDSLQSSLSGLSFYQDEYNELKHLVNTSKYSDEQFQTVQELVKRNQELETELVKASKQINRLVDCHNSFGVEKELQELWSSNAKLRDLNAKLQKEKCELESECKGLKLSLADCKTQSEVNKSLVESLKEKVSQHYVEWQQGVKHSTRLQLVVSDLTNQLKEAAQVKLWYKTQFNQWKTTKTTLQTCEAQLESFKIENAKLQLQLTECKSELEKTHLKALKEKSELLLKLEKINLDFTPSKPIISATPCNTCTQNEEAITQLQTQLSISTLQTKQLIEENSTTTSKCHLLHFELQQKDREIQEFGVREKESSIQLQRVRESELIKERVIQELKMEIAGLKVKLDGQKADKTTVERQIEVLRNQFAQFKANYSVVSPRLQQKTAELERDNTKDESDNLERATDDQKVELRLQNHTKTMLKSIEEHVTNFFDSLNTEEFESHVDIRLKYLDERLRALQGKLSRSKLLENRVKDLEVLLQVRERELKEKQLRMDRNNRTLLRKVKEHMKGRNYAEKQVENWRKLYEKLTEEHQIKCNSQKELIQNLRNQLVEKEKLRQLNSSDLQQTVEHLEEPEVQSEKYFFQRLSKDLHVALSAYNKVNQEPYDEESIRQLLDESKQICGSTVASWEVKLGLDGLREEICNLQAQIVMKS